MRLHIWSNAGHRTQDTFALSCTSVGARRAALLGTLSRVSSAEEWYFTVPDDDAELPAEFRRHGVRPGAGCMCRSSLMNRSPSAMPILAWVALTRRS